MKGVDHDFVECPLDHQEMSRLTLKLSKKLVMKVASNNTDENAVIIVFDKRRVILF